jgi:hypothetical protein
VLAASACHLTHPLASVVKRSDMRAEIESIVDEIQQAISLLRRHL